MEETLGRYMTRDGKLLAFRKWQGTGDTIVYLHGIESNSGWFSQLALQLTGRGFTLYGIDRRGSGLNEENRGDIKDYNVFFDDIEDALRLVKEQASGKKIYIMGICWGALLAVNYILKGKMNPDGLILLSPAIYRKVDLSPWAKALAGICSLCYPEARFKIPINDRMFTANERYLNFIKNDKMRLRYLTCRFFNEIVKMEKDFGPLNDGIILPVIVLLAGHDDIVDNERVKKWFSALPLRDKTMKIFDDFHHVMPFEEEMTPLVDCIKGWIKEKEASFEIQSIKN